MDVKLFKDMHANQLIEVLIGNYVPSWDNFLNWLKTYDGVYKTTGVPPIKGGRTLEYADDPRGTITLDFQWELNQFDRAGVQNYTMSCVYYGPDSPPILRILCYFRNNGRPTIWPGDFYGDNISAAVPGVKYRAPSIHVWTEDGGRRHSLLENMPTHISGERLQYEMEQVCIGTCVERGVHETIATLRMRNGFFICRIAKCANDGHVDEEKQKKKVLEELSDQVRCLLMYENHCERIKQEQIEKEASK